MYFCNSTVVYFEFLLLDWYARKYNIPKDSCNDKPYNIFHSTLHTLLKILTCSLGAKKHLALTIVA